MNFFSNSSPKKRKVNTNSKNDGSTVENHESQVIKNTVSEAEAETESQLVDLNRYLKRDLESSEAANRKLKEELKKSKEELKKVIRQMVNPSAPIFYDSSMNPITHDERLMSQCVYSDNASALNILLKNKDKFEVGVGPVQYGDSDNDHFENPLYISAIHGNYECAQVLISHGFDPTKIDNMRKHNVLYDLISYKDKHQSDYHIEEFSEKINYSWKNLEEFAKLLISSGVDLNYQDISGITVSHQSANDKNLNSIKFVEFFGRSGADFNVKTKKSPDSLQYWQQGNKMFEQTPLHLALRPSQLEGLLFHTYQHDTPPSHLTAASEISKNRQKIVEILLKYGADPNICDQFGNNFLHYAAVCGFLEFYSEITTSSSKFLRLRIDEMLNKNVDKTNDSGDTPLILALQLMWDQDEAAIVRTVDLLHENGANLSHKNEFGYTPLLIAKMRNLSCVVDCLERLSAKMGVKGKITQSDASPAVSGMEKNELFEIVKSYGFDKYGCSRSNIKSSSEYLRKLVLLDLGRFSTEYKHEIEPEYDAAELKHVKVRVNKFSSVRSISKFITSDPELKTLFVDKFGDGRLFKEELCLVCLTDAPEKTFLPCGHQAICADCLGAADFEDCPMCKQKIEIIL